MKNLLLAAFAVIFIFGCARLSVQGSKEPIKVDISMRLDIYQHVQKDIDSVENIVSGAKEEKVSVDKQSFLDKLIPSAFAQDAISPEVEQAALSRKERLAQLRSFQGKGVLGEDNTGLVEVRDSSDPAASRLAEQENSDRMVIYSSIASKNKTSVEDIQVIYAKRLQNDAPAGTPVQNQEGQWKAK